MKEENTQSNKSQRALEEEAVLAFWKENTIFEKTVAKNAPKGEYVFYEGPPTANAKPALHHLEARAFKDVIPRYKTMQGYHVPRRAGWDTHGLPVELQIEKKLGLTSKKQIEEYGVAQFNKECKDSVFTYIKDWEDFTDRIGYWVDKKSAYYTFNNDYIESLWNIVGKINDRGLLYKDYRIVPWCPRCGTGLSSHELAQGYQDVKDVSVYVKFKVVGQDNTYILAWTTTPWTLPGNVALAIGSGISYVKILIGNEYYILAQERLSVITEQYTIVESCSGSDLVGLEYEPLFPELKNYMQSSNKEEYSNWANGWKVYAGDFVTTTDGTGVVHIAPMYGNDDFDLATKNKLPKLHTVDDAGHFISSLVPEFLAGKYAKEKDEKGKPLTDVAIIDYLTEKGLFFNKETITHTYPHCWRCKTPLLYYARDSWYVRMSELRDDLLKANETINWEPSHIKEGRFGEWLREVKDWAFSRERYWGTPLPVWSTEDGERVVVDSIEKLKSLAKKSGNTYIIMRHGQTDHNVREEWNCDRNTPDPLTDTGIEQVRTAAKAFEGSVDLVITSPFSRTKKTAELFLETKGIDVEVVEDERLREWFVGEQFNNKPFSDYFAVRNTSADRYGFKAEDGESYKDILIRAGEFLYDIEQKYQGKTILIVTHGAIARALDLHTHGISYDSLYDKTRVYKNFENADIREVSFAPLPHNERYELDLHKPYIDQVELFNDGKKLTRAKEVIDVWFDSGSMPFAQEHYMGSGALTYPADFISEAIDQTRGWFYTMLAVGVLMERGSPYKNVICLGHLLDKDGKKMSKSIGNIVEPFEQMNKFGVDAVRWWMYSVNAPGESKNYDEKSVAEINNKVFNLFGNVLSFYELYRDASLEAELSKSENVLDQWIMARLNKTVVEATEALDAYDLFKPTRTIRDFIDDLSTWYLRRSRDRIKDEASQPAYAGYGEARQTLYYVLKTTAQLMAPFAPFFGEYVWQKLKKANDAESVHLSKWPNNGEANNELLSAMVHARNFTTMGNGLRKKNNIPIRQPLNKFSIKHTFSSIPYWDEIKKILAEELNVKEVQLDQSGEEGPGFDFEWEITPELKLEGEYRELVRLVQDMRKEKGLTPQEEISLTLPEKYDEIVSKFGEDLKKTVGAKEVSIKGEELLIS